VSEQRLLFSVTKNDFEIQTFRSGGKGGQNQNKLETGVRLIHKASGARGEARDSRSQWGNKQAAFRRLVESPKFRAWHKLECARRILNLKTIDQVVDEQMRPENLKVEFVGE
jgi:protein subunit release factor B